MAKCRSDELINVSLTRLLHTFDDLIRADIGLLRLRRAAV
jgi:hypothetical protein